MVLSDDNLVTVRCREAGIYTNKVIVGEKVTQGQLLAEITDPFEGAIKESLLAPTDGTFFFLHNAPLVYANTAVMKIVHKVD